MVDQVSSLKTGIKHKDTPIGKIPVDWEVERLKRIVTEFYNGGTPDTKNEGYWNGNIPWITGADFENQKVKMIRRYITSDGVKNSATNVISRGNLLIVTRTGVGKVAIAPFDIAISQDITGVILNPQRALPEFIYWYLGYISNKLKSMIQGTSINGLLRGDLEQINLPLPTMSEQKKIAEILTTVDEAIEKMDQIIEKTKEVKTGLMQKLLTRGIGHKKFKETEIGEIPKEWEVVKLGTLTETITKGTTPTTFGFNFTESGINFVKVESIGENGNFILQNIPHISGEANKALNRSKLQEFDLLFSIAGALGRVAIVGKKLLPANTNQALAIIRLKKNGIAMVEYLKYCLMGPIIQGYIEKIAVQSAQANLSLKQVNDLLLSLPTLDEQKQIAEILSSVDEEIEKDTNHREQLETLKKGLMQVLLTGKIRVS